MNFTKTFATRALLPAMLAAASLAAHACAEEQGPVAVVVRYDDLNLSAVAGVAILKRRVSKAAARVCADQHGGSSIRDTGWQSCMRHTTADALAQVKWPAK